MYATRHTVTIVTDGSGDGIGYTPVVNGRILEIVYVKTDYAAGVDFVVTTEATSRAVWSEENVNASTVRSPRQATHSIVGAALNYNDESDEPVCVPIVVADERIKIVVDEGGDTKTGTFHVIVG